MTTQSSRNNSESFFIEYNVDLLDDSTSIYKAYHDRLEPLSALKSKIAYHEELLDLYTNYYKNKPKEGAQFLIEQLAPLGFNSVTPYRIDSISYDYDSLQHVAKNGAKTTQKAFSKDNHAEHESFPITMNCTNYQGDDEKLKECFQKYILNHVSENYIYPKNGREDRVKGRSYVNFVIQTDKTIDKIYIIKGAHPWLDFEAIRVVSKIPDMYQPAIKDEKPVQMGFTLPINAKL
ncbi:energy transducer TonB [Owenweeksia hongkongensis]|uniref:energy transducer TonB n=1 Tax=Owenweeksia hongkongensis TaxID=253245 RepID=UPI003A8EB0C8